MRADGRCDANARRDARKDIMKETDGEKEREAHVHALRTSRLAACAAGECGEGPPDTALAFAPWSSQSMPGAG